MDQQEIKTLRLFEALEEDGFQSQRELSKKLDISLGLVNAMLRRIVKKGYYKVVSAHKSRFKYVLTPKGIAERSLLSYRYILFSIKYYSDVRKKLRAFFDYLEQTNAINLIFLGVSEIAEIAYITAKESNLHLIGIVDEHMCGKKFLDMQIQNLSLLNTQAYDFIVITDIENAHQRITSLFQQGIEKEKIVKLL